MFEPSSGEMIVFAVLLAASAAGFWLRFGVVLARIRTATRTFF
jgi:hypothetical protein